MTKISKMFIFIEADIGITNTHADSFLAHSIENYEKIK